MFKHPLLMSLSFAAAAIAGLIGWQCHSRSQQDWTRAKIERLINDELPTGCTRQQAIGWLDRHGLPYSVYPATDIGGPRYWAKDAGINEETVGDVLQCDALPSFDGVMSLVVTHEIELLLFFDKHGKLAGHAIEVYVDCL